MVFTIYSLNLVVSTDKSSIYKHRIDTSNRGLIHEDYNSNLYYGCIH